MELVGQCVVCGNNVYCRDGFLDGIVVDSKPYCHECAEKQEEKPTEERK